jgi:alpha-tubulin suppressor-like RCC1 family protein
MSKLNKTCRLHFLHMVLAIMIALLGLSSSGEAAEAKISAGLAHTLMINSDGTLWAWGTNNDGQLGDGTGVDSPTPRLVNSDTNWVAVSASRHSSAIKSDGTLWGWGWNSSGELGDGTTTNRWSPVQIGTDTTWVSVSAGTNQTLAIKSDGTLWAWGNNYFGQLGDGTSGSGSDKWSPVQIGTDTDWLSVSSGSAHTVAIKTDGTMWAWGYNIFGQLGNNSSDSNPHPTPVKVGTDNNWVSASAGGYHTLALKSDGTIWAWGSNSNGQLCNGTIDTNPHPTPVKVQPRIGRGSQPAAVIRSQFYPTGISWRGVSTATGRSVKEQQQTDPVCITLPVLTTSGLQLPQVQITP